MKNRKLIITLAIFLAFPILFVSGLAQPPEKKKKNKNEGVRTVTIPISIFTKQELKEDQAEEFIEAGQIIVEEDQDQQIILSIKSVSNTPLALALVIQDDLSTDVNLHLKKIKEFIRQLPRGSRVMVAYLRGGSLDIEQKFTDDLEAAAKSIRIVTGVSGVAPRNPYDGVIDTLKRFEALPNGRRAILLFSDGLDVSNGFSSSIPGQSQDLEKAILRAQRAGVAIYSFYASASLTQNGNSNLILNAQSSLNKLSDETGGRAFFQGTFTPVSFEPFFRDLGILLNRQFALTYLSTHLKKGYHKVKVYSTNPEVKIEHPEGYYHR
ncbi:MAG: hypothetical protein R2747_04370 [Pyrinomonadaceae bacterium]